MMGHGLGLRWPWISLCFAPPMPGASAPPCPRRCPVPLPPPTLIASLGLPAVVQAAGIWRRRRSCGGRRATPGTPPCSCPQVRQGRYTLLASLNMRLLGRGLKCMHAYIAATRRPHGLPCQFLTLRLPQPCVVLSRYCHCTAGSVTEYKYVLLDASGTRAMAWQDGNNSLLSVRLAEGAVPGGLSVYDDW